MRYALRSQYRVTTSNRKSLALPSARTLRFTLINVAMLKSMPANHPEITRGPPTTVAVEKVKSAFEGSPGMIQSSGCLDPFAYTSTVGRSNGGEARPVAVALVSDGARHSHGAGRALSAADDHRDVQVSPSRMGSGNRRWRRPRCRRQAGGHQRPAARSPLASSIPDFTERARLRTDPRRRHHPARPELRRRRLHHRPAKAGPHTRTD